MKTDSRFVLLCLVGITLLVLVSEVSPSTASASEEEPMPFACKITVPSAQWSKSDGPGLTLTITNKSKQAATFRVLLSIRLISVPSSAGEPTLEFWAPFSLKQPQAGKEGRDWYDLGLAKGESIRREIAASRLLWGPVESSVWPARPFAETIPNGQYRLHVQIDFKGQQPVVSNDVALSVSN